MQNLSGPTHINLAHYEHAFRVRRREVIAALERALDGARGTQYDNDDLAWFRKPIGAL